MSPKSTPASPKEISATPEATATQKVSGGGKRILIVEDERPLSHALEMKLKHEGFNTCTVTNGAEAIEEVKKDNDCLILLDLIMPVMDGFGVLEELKKLGKKIPVIVLSNLGQVEDREKAKQLGAIDYFVKSNTPIADIVTRVRSALA